MSLSRKQALLNGLSPSPQKLNASPSQHKSNIRVSERSQRLVQPHIQSKFDELEQEEDFESLKEKNGANKRRRVQDDIDVEPNSSQNTIDMTTAANGRTDPGAIDFSLYTRAMLDDQANHKESDACSSLFNSKPLLKISKLRLSLQQSRHLKENKLSEKMGRRDIQFYDMYKREKPASDVQKLADKGYLLDGILKGDIIDEKTGLVTGTIDDSNEPIYGDIEVDDFNKLFRNQQLIQEQFGKSINVRLDTSHPDGSVTRHVKEDLSKVKLEGDDDFGCDDPHEMSMYSVAGAALSNYQPDEDEEAPTEFANATMENTTLIVLI